ncbi:MAG: hypothetical protein IH616_09715 [Gemmatimonadales bacterium]|nr:hypothetical protein [Gemmatimonadales bacterium]
MERLIRCHSGALMLGVALFLPFGGVTAQDYMGMAELYGQGVVNSLGNQIRSAGIRSSMGEDGRTLRGATSGAAASWPAHITADNIGSHVFTVDELMTMNAADSSRTRQMLEGRKIRVSGTVVHAPKADHAINLVDGSGRKFQVFASFPGGRGMPRAGAHATVQGTVGRVRRTTMNLRNPQVTGKGVTRSAAAKPAAPSASAPPSGTAGVDPGSRPDYESLKFRRTSAVTDELAERFAETLAPALTKGRNKEQIADLVRGGQLQDGFRKLLQPYGLSDRDVADVLASHMVMTWQVANDHSSQPPRSDVLAVRTQVRETLARAAWVRAMDDADKQRFAESLSVGTMMIVGRYVHGYETKDRATIDMAIRDARDMARSFANIDMTHLALTDQGLVRR